MKRNVFWWDRLLRFILGNLMLIWTIAGGPTWGYVGVYLLATGSWGFCPLYALMNRGPLEPG